METIKKDYLVSLLGNDLFLKQFTPQLRALNQDADFMDLINQIAVEASKKHVNFKAEKDLAKKSFTSKPSISSFRNTRRLRILSKTRATQKIPLLFPPIVPCE